MNPDIFVFDDLNPEDNAMLQALYSRSPRSVVEHVEKVKDSGSGSFMDRYYVGYGHASIGDCGSTTLYIENVSMLVAKSVQDHALYNGQEASTRYLDFASQPQVDPYNRPESASIQQQWVALYTKTLPKVRSALARRYPFQAEVHHTEAQWEKAMAARAFDTVRCLLPVGTTTLVSWHTNLRQARDHLRRLVHHPLPEIRQVAAKAYSVLLDTYPHSFKADDIAPDSIRHAARNDFMESDALADNILMPEAVMERIGAAGVARVKAGEVAADLSLFDIQSVNRAESRMLAQRPAWAPLPRRLLQYGVFNLSFLLDFGSFRDLQRHRNGYCPLPFVGPQFGFHTWYLRELDALLSPADSASLRAEIHRLIEAIHTLPRHGVETTPLLDQYLYPMGMACLCHLTYSLPQMVYVAELRSSQTVHPTLRPIAQALGRLLKQTLPTLNFALDETPDTFSAQRGAQDIVERQAVGG